MNTVAPNDLRSLESRLDNLRSNLTDVKLRLIDYRNFLRGCSPPEVSDQRSDAILSPNGYVQALHQHINSCNEILSDIQSFITQITEA